jgi:hypothetical protein
MARLTIEDRWWTDPRRERLSEIVGGIDHADVVAVKAWRLAQEFWKQAFGLVPKALFFRLKHPEALIEAGLAEVQAEAVYVRGSRDYLTWAAEMREAASIGGKKSAQRPRDAKGRLKKTSKRTPSDVQANSKAVQVSDSDSVFDSDSGSENSVGQKNEKPAPKGIFVAAYVRAYQARYGARARPDLQGKVQGMISRFVDQTPIERACDLIQVYCQMNDPWFLTKAHDFGTFVENLSKVGLALDTGKVITRTEAHQLDRKQATANVFDKLIREAEEKEAGHG